MKLLLLLCAAFIVLAHAAFAQPVPTAGAATRYGPAAVGVTNWIRNSTIVGAIAGTPGTLPTNWIQSNNSGITPAVIGTGIEGGIPYVDLQFVGTTTGAINNILFEPTGAAAGPNQTWTGSFYWRLVGGTLTNLPSVAFYVADNIANQATLPTLPTSAPLATQRPSFTMTTNAGAVTSVNITVQFRPTASSAINFTIRIGAPQLQFNAFVSAWIPTSGTATSSGASTIGFSQ